MFAVFHLHPVLRPAGLIGPVSAFADHTLKPELACLAEQVRADQMARRKCHPAVVRAAYLETPFSGHRARHEALDYFVWYAAVTGPTVVIPDQRTAITIRPRHHGLVGHVCPHAIKPDFVVTSRLVLCLPVTRFDVRRV